MMLYLLLRLFAKYPKVFLWSILAVVAAVVLASLLEAYGIAGFFVLAGAIAMLVWLIRLLERVDGWFKEKERHG